MTPSSSPTDQSDGKVSWEWTTGFTVFAILFLFVLLIVCLGGGYFLVHLVEQHQLVLKEKEEAEEPLLYLDGHSLEEDFLEGDILPTIPIEQPESSLLIQ